MRSHHLWYTRYRVPLLQSGGIAEYLCTFPSALECPSIPVVRWLLTYFYYIFWQRYCVQSMHYSTELSLKVGLRVMHYADLSRCPWINTVRMSTTLNRCFALQRFVFAHDNVVEIHNGIMSDFYLGLPHTSTRKNSITSCTIILRLWVVHWPGKPCKQIP